MSIRLPLPFFVLALLTTAVRGDAQTRLIANVPFDFTVHGRDFAAGKYEVRMPDSAGGIIMIDNVQDRTAMFASTYPSGGHDPAGEQPVLVFDHRENKYALAEVWVSGTEGESLAGLKRTSHPRATAHTDETYVLASNAP